MKLVLPQIALALLLAGSALSQSIVDVATSAGLSTLLSLVTLADLAGPLTDGAANLTVLAPTNQAFQNLSSAIVSTLTRTFNKDWLRSVLTYHVLPNRYPKSVVLTLAGSQTPSTLQGSAIQVAVTGGKIFLSPAVPSAAEVIVPDVEFFNGKRRSVAHVINAVLVPPSKFVLR
jgi:uncharacterized surface protein with fasciclin (FAS1) repeats